MSAAPQLQSKLNPGPLGRNPRTGRNTAIAMGVLAAGFASFFFSMKYRDEKRRSSGNLHQYEHTLSIRPREHHLHEAQATGSDSASTTISSRTPVYTHDAQHHARTPGWMTATEGVHAHHSAGGHIHQPAPQRERGDGSGLVYTKKV